MRQLKLFSAPSHKVTKPFGLGPRLCWVRGRQPLGHLGSDKHSNVIDTDHIIATEPSLKALNPIIATYCNARKHLGTYRYNSTL